MERLEWRAEELVRLQGWHWAVPFNTLVSGIVHRPVRSVDQRFEKREAGGYRDVGHPD